MAICNSSQTKGPGHKSARAELLRPVLAYYQGFLAKHAGDKKMLPQVCAAQFRVAALQAKSGSLDCIGSLTKAFDYLAEIRAAKLGPESYPNLQAVAFRFVTPNEWVPVKSFDEARTYGVGLFISLQGAISLGQQLAFQNPQVDTFHENVAGLDKISATLQAMIPNREAQSLAAWVDARNHLEILLHDRPQDADAKNRLIESLVAAAKLQRVARDNDAGNQQLSASRRASRTTRGGEPQRRIASKRTECHHCGIGETETSPNRRQGCSADGRAGHGFTGHGSNT